MNLTRVRPPARTLLLASAVAAVMLIAGCGSPGTSSEGEDRSGTDAGAHIDPLDPAHLDASATATTAMQVILSWQPAVDGSKSDALARARPWLGGDLADAVDETTGPAPTLRPDREWAAWKQAGDALTASCTEAESTPAAPEGMRTLVIDVDCRQTVLHASGSSTTLPTQTWRTTVTHTDDGWRLTGFRYQ